jgi:DnaJ-class molecular chaperone
MSKNLYNILEIDNTCSSHDIKKAYHKLANKYHPDKYKNPDNKTVTQEDINNKFIDIKNAYDILSDPEKRIVYDSMNYAEQDEFYDSLKNFLKIHFSDIDQYINFFFDNDNNLKDYIKKLDIFGMYNQIISKVSTIDINNMHVKKSDIIDINITAKIFTTFSDRYNNKYRKIQVKRKTKDDIFLYVPLRETLYIVQNEGEYVNNTHGNIILQIELIDENINLLDNEINISNNIIIDTSHLLTIIENDLYITVYISLYDYLYGGDINIILFGNNIDVKYESFINRVPVEIIDNFGLPNEDNSRGKFIILFRIRSIDNLKEQIRLL